MKHFRFGVIGGISKICKSKRTARSVIFVSVAVNVLCATFGSGSGIEMVAFSIASKETKGASNNRIMQPWTFTTINLYGINNKTGEVILFITVNNKTDAKVVNATAIDLKDGNPKNSIMEAIFPFPHLLAKIGDKYKACAMVLKDFDYVCYIGSYSPTEGSQSISLLLNSYKHR